MESTDAAGGMNESQFMAELEKKTPDLAALLASLEALRAAGDVATAESRAEVLQDSLVEKGSIDEALTVLERRIAWVNGREGLAAQWQQEAYDVLGSSWESKTLIESAQGERIISARESLRRLHLLKSLAEGVFVHDRTWGMGVVTKVDLFNRKVEIDFERKLGHTLSLAYAAETLSCIGPDHLLVWKKNKSAELKTLVKDQPAEVIRMYLRSFGPGTVVQIQQQLQAGIVEASDWKRFWDAARKALKEDPQVQLPALRTEALRLQQGEVARGGGWFEALNRERDLSALVGRFEEMAEGKVPAAATDAERRILSDRIQYAVKGATAKQMGIKARVLVAAARLGLPALADVVVLGREALYEPSAFQTCLRQLPVRATRNFLKFLAEPDAARLIRMLEGLLVSAEISTLNEAIAYLIENGREEDVANAYRRALSSRKPTVEQLSWLSRNMERIDAWSLGSYAPWLMMMIDEMEEAYNGERLKAQNQMREKFARKEWLEDVMANLDNQQRRNLIVRAKDSAAWPVLDRQVVLANMVKLYPPLEEMLSNRGKDAAPPAKALLTSLRSYRERQIQLQRITQIELPRVAQDIALARSYGDLRENHEFKSAKEHQLVLMRKRDELEDMLRRVTPSDFKGLPAEAAGLATTVSIVYGDGRREQYHILGEWDGETTMGIISCNSRMAQALTGKRTGDTVTVPTEVGTADCRVESVGALPHNIVEWLMHEASP